MAMKHMVTATATVIALVGTLAACGGGGDTSTEDDAAALELNGQSVSVAAVWTGVEQKNFQKVLAAFEKKTGAKTELISTGDNVSTVIGSKIEGGNAPDVVMVPQLGVLQQFARSGWLRPLPSAATTAADQNFAKVWTDYGTVDGKRYGLYFKASNKSTVWYSPKALEDAGATVPTTWDELIKTADAVAESGVPAFSVAGEAGWPLTDWFENIYLSQAGPEKYDRLAKHEIPWTDPTVITALTTLGKLFGDDKLVAGGRTGALQTDFPESVEQVFGNSPKAAMVYEGDFVAGLISGELGKKVGTDANFFPFPKVGKGAAPVVGGGDAAVVLKAGKNAKAADALLAFLATPEAAEVWAAAGGFTSPNKAVDAKVYPDDIARQSAVALTGAGDGVRFDMSDQAPAAFGGTQGAGEWKILQDFLRDPSDPAATARTLEAAAVKAYKG
ncbi:ABC transporter substrate-binding protein [Streptomyces zaomyceticus]|uniref:ABC transporter substrate-binding protein n=1 Tax=Streptomyces zaomyceticus TaxID=68286 RepID=UPI003698AD5F